MKVWIPKSEHGIELTLYIFKDLHDAIVSAVKATEHTGIVWMAVPYG